MSVTRTNTVTNHYTYRFLYLFFFFLSRISVNIIFSHYIISVTRQCKTVLHIIIIPTPQYGTTASFERFPRIYHFYFNYKYSSFLILYLCLLFFLLYYIYNIIHNFLISKMACCTIFSEY